MKKSSLRTVKEKNRRLILRALLTEGGLSRIELAKQTGLSPSTITALVGELLAEGVVQESGLRAATAGRSRAGLTICPDYGRVVVVDIGRSHAVLYLYDMALQCVFRTVLPDHGGDGNELLTSISDAIFQGFSMEELHAGKMKSIGLLFQDDTEISEFRVMYSTCHTLATTHLREALFTRVTWRIVDQCLHGAVITGHRYIPGHGNSPCLQGITQGNGHHIVGAYHPVRLWHLSVQDLIGEILRSVHPEVPVENLFLRNRKSIVPKRL